MSGELPRKCFPDITAINPPENDPSEFAVAASPIFFMVKLVNYTPGKHHAWPANEHTYLLAADFE